jgi:predicted TIM-barrel fold metal-dependent hydrolase
MSNVPAAEVKPGVDISKVLAIDIHTHAEVSCHDHEDPIMAKFFDAATTYFKADRKRPTIPETVAYYRAQNIAFVMFTVDMESGTGIKRISNEEIACFARDNADIMIPFASIDPHKGKYGALEARRLVEEFGVKGFKFHPPLQNFTPNDRMAYPLYEVIAHYKLPAIFHTGHSGMGTGMRGGGGVRLKYGQPILVDDVAVDFIDLSGWSPKYFPPQVITYANSQLRHKMLFGSDFPLIKPEKWLAAATAAGFREEVMPGILKGNAARVLGLA